MTAIGAAVTTLLQQHDVNTQWSGMLKMHSPVEQHVQHEITAQIALAATHMYSTTTSMPLLGFCPPPMRTSV